MRKEVIKKEKMANLEVLRCVAMMMVVALHYLGKGNLLGDTNVPGMSGTGLVAWVLEAFCIVAVNVYMLISGYFLSTSSFKLSRLITLWLQIWFYSVSVGLLAAVTGILPAEEFDTHYLLTLLFPVSMEHYWFVTAYVFLYVMMPLVTLAVKRMNKKQMQLVVAVLLMMFCVLKSVLPFRLETDTKGYSCIWYLCVFMTAAYIRKFGCPLLNKRWKAVCLYVVASLLALAEMLALRYVYLRTGSFELIMGISFEYNHILPFLASIGFFMAFAMTEVSGFFAKVAKTVGPYTLGVYLLHENVGVRYAWQNWLWADKVTGIGDVLALTLIAVVTVFVIGVSVDMLRSYLMKGVHVILLKLAPYRKIVSKMEMAYVSCGEDEECNK